MFGRRKEPSSPGQAALAGMAEQSDEKGKGEGYSGSGFDPRGLERAARAAKILDKSPNAKHALEVIKAQQRTKQEEHRAKVAEYEAYEKQTELKRVEAEAEAARQTLEHQTEHEKRRSQYQDKLDRQRYVDQFQADRQRKEEDVKRQEDMIRRQELMKRKTLELEADLRKKTELARVDAETAGKIKQERENHDLRLEEAKVSAQEYRETVLEGIKLAGETIGAGLTTFLGDKEKMVAATATLTALALGVYTARTGTGVAGRYIEAQLGKPSLVRETSRRTANDSIKALAKKDTWLNIIGLGPKPKALDGVVLEGKLERRLSRVANSTANTKKNKAPFRHLLLYGPPGTGKTLFAKGLARSSGLDYAIMTGGDIAPLGRDAVTEMHKLFDWANTSGKGLLLFVDEADAFLRRRSKEHISEDLRNALNAFLYRTGEATDKFMLVYASNQPEQFDWAINDRIDEMVHFALPGQQERLQMINLYMKKYLLDQDSKAKAISVTGIEEAHLESIAAMTEGFSGREIAKLAIAWQAAAYGGANGEFTKELMDEVLEAHLEQKAQKQQWLERAQHKVKVLSEAEVAALVDNQGTAKPHKL